MSSFGVNELTQLGAYGFTVRGKVTLQNAVVIGSQKFNSSPRMSSEISSVGDFESVYYLCSYEKKLNSHWDAVFEIDRRVAAGDCWNNKANGERIIGYRGRTKKFCALPV